MTNNPEKLKEGDEVRLKTENGFSHEWMTILSINGENATCVWRNKMGDKQEESFSLSILTSQ